MMQVGKKHLEMEFLLRKFEIELMRLVTEMRALKVSKSRKQFMCFVQNIFRLLVFGVLVTLVA